ncbi:MAG TPA: neuraminidase-like domain-containing protein [Longimicrobiaceae bacterium]|nr:neuraminidase-like domain-containing protein [Longimicrobiaceae bacterium]
MEFLLRVGELTGNHAGLAGQVARLRREGRVRSERELARLDAADWRALIDAAGGEAPRLDAGSPAKGPGAEDGDPAEALARAVQAAHPTAAVAYRLERERDGELRLEPGRSAAVAEFLLENPDFDLGRSRVDEFLDERRARRGAAEPGAAAKGGDDAALAGELKMLQRVYRIAPRYAAMRPLLAEGLHTAHAVARMRRSEFVERFGGAMGEAEARRVHARARQSAATALHLLARFGGAFNTVSPAAIGGAAPAPGDADGPAALLAAEGGKAQGVALSSSTRQVPDLEALFGPMSYCECTHCRSVYSPAAYLVDVLAFLGRIPSRTAGRSALDVLLSPGRRPDLGGIELSCENTNTPLPYIDLVNEVLENAVAPRPAEAPLPQTRGTADELAASPEHTNDAAYEALAAAVYPWGFPFDRWLEETRVHLEHVGVRRHELMATFRRDCFTFAPTQLCIAAEHLGLSRTERALVTGSASPVTQPWRRWGFDQPGAARLSANYALADSGGRATASSVRDWDADLRRVNDGDRRGVNTYQPASWADATPFEFPDWVGVEFMGPRRIDTVVVVTTQDNRYDGGEPAEGDTFSYSGIVDFDVQYQDGGVWRTVPGGAIRGNSLVVRRVTFSPLTTRRIRVVVHAAIGEGSYSEVVELEAYAMLPGWVADLTALPEFLRRTGLSAAEVEPLLQCRFIDPDGRIDLVRAHDATPPEEVRIDGLDAESLTRIHGFVRLRRRLGWSIRELDRAIAALQPMDAQRRVALTDDLVRQLSHVERLRKALGVQVQTVLGWWAPLDTWSYPDGEASPYARVFLDRSLFNPPNPAFEVENLGQAGSTVSGVSASVAAALGVTAAELAALAAAELPGDALTLAGLSHLHRLVTFARALRLAPAELLSLRALCSIDPLRPRLPAEPVQTSDTLNTMRFVELVRKVRASGMRIAELDYLLRDARPAQAGIAPDERRVEAVLRDVRGALRKLADETAAVTDPTGELTRARLSLVLGPETAEEAVRLLAADPAEDAEAKRAFVLAHFAAFLDPADAQAKLAGGGPSVIPDPAGRYGYVLAGVQAHLRRTQGRALVVQKLGENLGLDAELAEALLLHRLQARNRPGALVEDFRALADGEDATAAFLLLHKAATLATAFRLGAAELAHLSQDAARFSGFDLNDLLVGGGDYSTVFFRRWERLFDYAALRDALPGGAQALLGVFRAAAESAEASGGVGLGAATVDAVAQATGWDRQEVLFLAAEWRLEDEDFRHEKRLVRMHACMQTAERLGVPASRAYAWATHHPVRAQAAEVRNAARARHDAARWAVVARPLRDALRERQRGALLAYLMERPALVGREEVRGPDELFEHFLIDVEMGTVQTTSRIKQAAGSAQLFVQRALMNLEPEVALRPEDVREWRWMKSYRVWEANRKVFLYPENWIEPELRDDKTPFFREMEDALLQQEVTQETVEDALRNYLEKLDGVARLEVCGMYHHVPGTDWEDPDPRDVLHVFARTPAAPHVYYYRRREDYRTWTPWEVVDVDVEGNHLCPVLHRGRLLLFWPVITEKANEPVVGGSTPASSPTKYYEVQLAWSELRNGRWSTKEVSRDAVRTTGTPPRHELLLMGGYGVLGDNWGGDPYGYATHVVLFQAVPQPSSGTTHARWLGVFRMSDGEKALRLSASWPGGTGWHYLPSWSRPRDNRFWDTGPVLSEYEFDIRSRGSTLFTNTRGDFEVAFAHQFMDVVGGIYRRSWSDGWGNQYSDTPFFFQDERRTMFFNKRESGYPYYNNSFMFENFQHPFVPDMMRKLAAEGVDGVLRLETQSVGRHFFHQYGPAARTTFIAEGATSGDDRVEFRTGGAYSQYNWELFFHLPILVADRLSRNQRFEEAQRWFHYVFNPTDGSSDPSPRRFWKMRWFYENAAGRPIDQLMKLLAHGGDDWDAQQEREQLQLQVQEWRRNPFNPHLIARLRATAYQKSVVMKYIDNLIAWGDQLFRQDTLETINEATQLYVLAAAILGPRPQALPEPKREVQTFNQLRGRLDDFSNAVMELETALPEPTYDDYGDDDEAFLRMPLYFGIPRNERLLGYWDTVADRLFKIRHSQNIDGVERTLALFEPPIDPALLVRATAAGVSVSDALGDAGAGVPTHRFPVAFQRAMELCGDVRSLGGALLSAIEKRDAEALSLLRQGHEMELLGSVRHVREQQVREARETLEGLKKGKELAQLRRDHYSALERRSSKERLYLGKLEAAHQKQLKGQRFQIAASVAYKLPDIDVGVSGISSPVLKARIGGSNIGDALQIYGSYLNMQASMESHKASMASITGGYERRDQDWDLQVRLAAREIEQIERQIVAAELRLAIAERELQNHDTQIRNAREVDAYMREKFSSRELYDWMVAQVSTLYFQSYQLALAAARRAERAHRFQTGSTDPEVVRAGHWDSLRRGLLAGEKLHFDLRRLEAAHQEKTRREYEITRNVSLAALDPMALLALRETGECYVELPESLFDADYPGHYMRRIRSVGLTLPCVTGPYTSVNCTLTLVSNSIRRSSVPEGPDGGYARSADAQDDRFADNVGAVQSVVTSGAQNDSGVFELSFRDEQYVPFEGAGAISRWRIELPADCNAWDVDTLSDVVFHLRYTAREGGGRLRDAARAEVVAPAERSGLVRMLSARRDLSSEWHRFLHSAAPDGAQTLELDLGRERFPFAARDREIAVESVELFLQLAETVPDDAVDAVQLPFSLVPGAGAPVAGRLEAAGSPLAGVPFGSASPAAGAGPYQVRVSGADVAALPAELKHTVVVGGAPQVRLNPEAVRDLWVVCRYGTTAAVA